MEVALEGDVDYDTSLNDIINKKRIRAGDIKEVSKAIHAYQERVAREREERQIEADVTRIEKGTSVRKWIPLFIIVGVLVVSGVVLWVLLKPKPRDKKFLPKLLFKDIDLARLTPLAASGVIIQNHATSTGPKTRRHRRHFRLLHHWAAVTSVDFTSSGSNAHGELAVDTIISVKNRFGRIISRCAQSEIKRNPGFHDASVSFLLKRSGTGSLTSVESHSGVTKAFVKCAKWGASSLHFPPYSGNAKVLTLPISRQ